MPEIKSLSIAHLYWNQLTPDQVAHLFREHKARANALGDFSYKATADLSKYLFAVNSGAAAGLFVLLISKTYEHWHLMAFFAFCGGTFLVGVGHFFLSSWAKDLTEGCTRDVAAWGRNEINLGQMDSRNHQRHRSFKAKAARAGLVLSFLCLVAGGSLAAIPFTVSGGNGADSLPAQTVLGK